MDQDTARSVYAELKGLGPDDPDALRLRDDLFLVAVRYARIRVDWRLAPPEERRAMDPGRTAAHNVLIDACNILSRYMNNAGMSTDWRDRLGTDRKEIGDFACHLHAFLGIEAR